MVFDSNVIKTPISSITQFVRINPIVSGAAVGAGILAAGIAIRQVVRRRKAKRKTIKRRKATKRNGRKRKSRVKRRRIIRGRGLGRGEIRHSGKGTRGTKLVSFRTKSGQLVKFKVKGTSKRRKGFRR